jgi:hypothetical protein
VLPSVAPPTPDRAYEPVGVMDGALAVGADVHALAYAVTVGDEGDFGGRTYALDGSRG